MQQLGVLDTGSHFETRIEVDAQGLYGTDVVGLAHTADFDKHGDESLDRK